MIARRGVTNEPLLINVFMARRLNNILGGPFFTPWDIPDLSEDLMDTILSIEEVNNLKAGMNQVEAIFTKWRSDYGRIKH